MTRPRFAPSRLGRPRVGYRSSDAAHAHPRVARRPNARGGRRGRPGRDVADLPPRQPRRGGGVRAVRPRGRRARDPAGDAVAGRVRGLEPARGSERRERGGRRGGARRSPRRRTVPHDGLVRRWTARARVRGVAPRTRLGGGHDRRRRAVRRGGSRVDRRDGGEQPDRVPARGARPGRAAPMDAAAGRGARRRGAGRDRVGAPQPDLAGGRGGGHRRRSASCWRRRSVGRSRTASGAGTTTISRSSGRGGSSSPRSGSRSRCGRGGRT